MCRKSRGQRHRAHVGRQSPQVSVRKPRGRLDGEPVAKGDYDLPRERLVGAVVSVGRLEVGGGGAGAGCPVAAGSVVVRSWPNLPPATQSVSLGQERPKSALVTPRIRCSVAHVPAPPVGAVLALTSPLLLLSWNSYWPALSPLEQPKSKIPKERAI